MKANPIARLPRTAREELNRRLRDGSAVPALLDWLNGLPAVRVRAKGRTQDGAGPVSEANPPEGTTTAETKLRHHRATSVSPAELAEWRETGFGDWLGQQEILAASRQIEEEVTELNPPGSEPLTERLAAWVAGRYVAQSARLRVGSGDPAEDRRRLEDFCRDVVALRRGDQAAARLRLDRERLAAERQEREARNPTVSKNLRRRKGLSTRVLKQIEKAAGLL